MEKYGWIRQIPSSLMKWDEVPLLGRSPSFPWKQFADLLSASLKVEPIALYQREVEWKPRSDYTKGFAKPLITHLTAGSVDGSLAFVMEREDLLKAMMQLLLQGEERATLLDEGLEKEFHTFLALEVLHLVGKVDFDRALSLQLNDEGELPEEAALSTDIAIEFGKMAMKGRLLISSTFRSSWVKRHTPKTPDAYLVEPLADSLQLDIHLQAGHVEIGREEWEEALPGDLLLLDSCGVDPDRGEGVVNLTLNGVAYFQASLKGGSIEILDSAKSTSTPRNKSCGGGTA